MKQDVAFSAMKAGDSEIKLWWILGTPEHLSDCSTTFGGYPRGESEPAPEGCSREYWYYGLVAQGWSYTFDAEGRLIDKYHWVSP
jgi:hypothetical protein